MRRRYAVLLFDPAGRFLAVLSLHRTRRGVKHRRTRHEVVADDDGLSFRWGSWPPPAVVADRYRRQRTEGGGHG